MGRVVSFVRHSPNSPDVFAPVNYRPTERCRTLVFDSADGNEYGKKFDAVAVQYALGEKLPAGFHIIQTPDFDGPLLRYTTTKTDGSICVALHRGDLDCKTYPKEDVTFVGLVFQFIRNLDTGERWELIHGPAFEGEGENAELPLFDVSG